MTTVQGALPNSFEARAIRRRVERRWLKSLRVATVPAVTIFALAILVFINTVPFLEAISGFQVDVTAQIQARLESSALALFIIQAVGLWILGIVSAIVSASAVPNRGGFMLKRLGVLQRRYSFLAWSIVTMRLLLLIVVIVTLILTFIPAFGFSVMADLGSSVYLDARYQPVTVALAAIIGLLMWTCGPFLRLRYSLALGMFAGSWSRQPDEKFWLALSARLLAEMAGVLVIIWGISLLNLVTYITFDPLPGAGSPNSVPAIIGMLPLETIGGSSWLGGAIIGCIYLAGQLGLPFMFIRIARWRLKRRERALSDVSDPGWTTYKPISESQSTSD